MPAPAYTGVVIDGVAANLNMDITADTPLLTKPQPGETWPVNETGPALTALQALANLFSAALSGTNLKTAVQSLPALVLAAGANAFGKLAANASGVLIGMVETTAPSAGFSGQFTVATAGTSVNLNGGTSQALRDGVEIACDVGSSGHLLVRWATGAGAGNGRRVYAGTSCFVAIDNINKVWVDASASASTGSWSAS